MTDQEHDRRMELYNQGKNDRQIGEIIGVGDTAIYKWRKQNGLKANYTPTVKDNRLELYEQGLTDQEREPQPDGYGVVMGGGYSHRWIEGASL